MSLNRSEPPGMGSVATLLAMDRTTLTAVLKPLERRGLLKITVDPSDFRGRIITLTTKGRRLLIRAVPIWQSTHAEVESLLPKGDPDRLRNNLRSLSSPLPPGGKRKVRQGNLSVRPI
jgi:DNA-binding MarR family transcriptional regulator